jgi:hypothetical protein
MKQTRRATVLCSRTLLGAVAAIALVSLPGMAQASGQEPAPYSPAIVVTPAIGHTGSEQFSSAEQSGSGGVKAVLLHPWGNCAPASGWGDLASNWSAFGTKPLHIDSTTFCNTATQVTYSALVADHASVLVFSDSAGDDYQFTAGEVAAITQYVQAGHNVVGTYATFLDTYNNPADNSALAPLFGLTSNFSGTPLSVTPDYTITNNLPALFHNVPNPYDSSGYGSTQSPAGGIWNRSALSGAKYRAKTSGDLAAITTFKSTVHHYQAVYISSMPEYSPSTTDEQFLYNALTLLP